MEQIKSKSYWIPKLHSQPSFIRKELQNLKSKGIYHDGQIYQYSNVLHYFAAKKYNDPVKNAQKNIFLNCLASARQYCPGTEILLSDFVRLQKQQSGARIERISSTQALESVMSYISKEKAKGIFRELVGLMGSMGRVHITEEPIDNDELILQTSCSINIAPDPRFSKLVDTNNLVMDYANVCILEGAPASVAEINALLLHCIKNNITLLFLARSFPEEVINTLATNWISKKLRVLPLIYGEKIENMNAHADLAAISGTHVLSAMKGSRIEEDIIEGMGSLLNVKITRRALYAKPTVSPATLALDLSRRLKKLDWAESDKRQIYLDRLAGISDKTLNIRLSSSIESWKIKNDLEIAINLYNHYCTQTISFSGPGNENIYPLSIYKKAKDIENVYNKLVSSIGGYLVTPQQNIGES